MDKQNVPLLTREDAIGIQAADKSCGFAPCPKMGALASGDAATYNTHTHEVVPKGMREAVERAIADLRRRAVSLNPYMSSNSMLDYAERLQRALNGEKT